MPWPLCIPFAQIQRATPVGCSVVLGSIVVDVSRPVQSVIDYLQAAKSKICSVESGRQILHDSVCDIGKWLQHFRSWQFLGSLQCGQHGFWNRDFSNTLLLRMACKEQRTRQCRFCFRTFTIRTKCQRPERIRKGILIVLDVRRNKRAKVFKVSGGDHFRMKTGNVPL